MLVEERRRRLLAEVERTGGTSTSALQGALGVSRDTISRDLTALATQGLLRQVRGGAVPADRAAGSSPGPVEEDRQYKQALASSVTELLRPGQVLFLDGGSSTLAVTRQLAADFAGTVVTNNPAVALQAAGLAHVAVVVLGGQLDPTSRATTGPETVRSLSALRLDWFLMGVCGLDLARGYTASTPAEAEVKRAGLAQAEHTCALLTPASLRTAGGYLVAGVADVDHAVTDDPTTAQGLRQRGVTVRSPAR